MARSIHDELNSLYAKFDQAERQWLNRIEDLGESFKKAYAMFSPHLPTGRSKPGTEDLTDIASNMTIGALGLSGLGGAVAVPIVYGLKKLAALVDTEVVPPKPDLGSLKTRLDDIKRSFRDTSEHMGGQIVKLMDKAAANDNAGTEAEIREAISTILLSPLWYPPSPNVTGGPGLPLAIHMRMWFTYWKQLSKLPPGALKIGIDLSPMWDHLKTIGFEPAGIEFVRWVSPGHKPSWLPKDDLFKNLQILNRYGERKKTLTIQHGYPDDVRRDIAVASVGGFVSKMLSNGHNDGLPGSNLTWASVSL